MKNKNLVALSLIATVLLCAGFVSLAAAEDEVPEPATTTTEAPLIAPAPGSEDAPDATPLRDPLADNSTSIDDGNQTYYTMDGEKGYTDESAEGNLIATRDTAATGPDYTLIIAGVAVVLAIVVGGVGVVYHHKKTSQTEA